MAGTTHRLFLCTLCIAAGGERGGAAGRAGCHRQLARQRRPLLQEARDKGEAARRSCHVTGGHDLAECGHGRDGQGGGHGPAQARYKGQPLPRALARSQSCVVAAVEGCLALKGQREEADDETLELARWQAPAVGERVVRAQAQDMSNEILQTQGGGLASDALSPGHRDSHAART